MKRRNWVALLAVLTLALSIRAGEVVSITRVIDGDTIKVWDGSKEVSVRLIGVDTPESTLNRKAIKDAEMWRVSEEAVIVAGTNATAFVKSVAPPGSTVRLELDKRPYDMYGRVLAYVYLPTGQCLNEELVKLGYAIVPLPYPFREKPRYLALQREAQRQQRGFWRTIWSSRGIP